MSRFGLCSSGVYARSDDGRRKSNVKRGGRMRRVILPACVIIRNGLWQYGDTGCLVVWRYGRSVWIDRTLYCRDDRGIAMGEGVYRYIYVYPPKIGPGKLFMEEKWRQSGYRTMSIVQKKEKLMKLPQKHISGYMLLHDDDGAMFICLKSHSRST